MRNLLFSGIEKSVFRRFSMIIIEQKQVLVVKIYSVLRRDELPFLFKYL